MAELSRRAVLAGLCATAACREAAVARPASGNAAKLIAAARRQIGVTLAYDPAYTRLAFPGGDVPRAKGVCTDVIIRAYRDALGIDLQALVNADMRRAFAAYPKRWGLRGTDASIDHRRVPNLQMFWKRAGVAVPITRSPRDWLPGDIFTSRVGANLPHTGIISDRTGASGAPLIIHNIGNGTREEDRLFDWPIDGHFRWNTG